MTPYLAVVGPQTPWPGSESSALAQFKGGASNTVLVIEADPHEVH